MKYQVWTFVKKDTKNNKTWWCFDAATRPRIDMMKRNNPQAIIPENRNPLWLTKTSKTVQNNIGMSVCCIETWVPIIQRGAVTQIHTSFTNSAWSYCKPTHLLAVGLLVMVFSSKPMI